MKKIVLIILIILCSYIFLSKEEHITSDSIRFRVISNSNSSIDLLMKEKVVYELSNILFKKNNISDTRSNIINNLSNI